MTSSTSTHATFWLCLWTLNNVGITLINKALFSSLHFPYPYTLTAIHMACCTVACQWIAHSIAQDQSNSKNGRDPKQNFWVRLLGEQMLQTSKVDRAGRRLLWAFSFIFTLNISSGNLSLKYVSINFNQVLRSLVPVLTMWCSMFVLKKPISMSRQRAAWNVVIGVAMASFGDRMSVTAVGFVYTLLCVILASVKVVASSELLTGSLKLHPVELLSYMAPAALMQCCILSVLTNEAAAIQARSDLNPINGDWKPVAVLLLSGFLAFSMNICALQAYKLTSPLTCCIAAAVKQVLMIIASTLLFRVRVTPLNGIGIGVVLVGSAFYSYVSVNEQMSSKAKLNKVEAIEVDEAFAHSDDSELGLEDVPLLASDERGSAVRR